MSKTTRRLGAFFFCVLGTFLTTSAKAQSPLGAEFRVNTLLQDIQREPVVAFAPDVGFLVSWISDLPPLPGDLFSRSGVMARLYSAEGKPLADPFLISEGDGTGASVPALASLPDRGFLTSWTELTSLAARPYDFEAKPLGQRVEIGFEAGVQQEFLAGVCALPSGAYATLSSETKASLIQDIRIRKLAPDGAPIARSEAVDSGHLDSALLYAAGIASSSTGRLLAVWDHAGTDGSGSAVLARGYDQDLSPLGASVQINTFTQGQQAADVGSVAAIGPDEFVVVWTSENQDGSGLGIFGQRLSLASGKLGPEFQINSLTRSTQWHASVAADPQGNFVVIWLSLANGRWEVRGQLYRRNGSRVGQEFRLNDKPLEQAYSWPQVAFGPNGTFVAVFESWDYVDDHDWDISAKRFSASIADEPCVVREGVFLCDTGRTGGEPEVAVRFANRPGDVPLMGDFDGDGRADLCAFRNGQLRCDLDHQGGVAEGILDVRGVIAAGDIPLLGDLDGDGRADLCLRRGGQLRCNLRHQPNSVDLTTGFGRPSDPLLLGDLDGDGRADLCVHRGGQLRCDTAHDGGMAEVKIAFGTPSDELLLGDFDGDGRADPCLWRSGELLCDTAHDGATAEGRLRLDFVAGDVPFLANLDGL